MGKTDGNFVSLSESPKEIFGKIMAWPDSLLASGFELLTDISQEETEKLFNRSQKCEDFIGKRDCSSLS